MRIILTVNRVCLCHAENQTSSKNEARPSLGQRSCCTPVPGKSTASTGKYLITDKRVKYAPIIDSVEPLWCVVQPNIPAITADSDNNNNKKICIAPFTKAAQKR